MQRSKKRWPALGFLLIIAECQDPDFEFLTFKLSSIKGDHLLGVTKESRFLGAAYHRWYPSPSQVRMPTDILINETSLGIWLLGSWSDTGDVKLPLMGGLPVMSLPWKSSKVGDSVVIEDRPGVEAWLKERVPEKVWRLKIE